MIFESHAHYEDKAFDGDREELLNKIHSGLIETIVDVGSTLESSRQALELSKSHDYIYAAVGIHPEEIRDFGIPGRMVSDEVNGRPCENFCPDEMPPEDFEWQENPTIKELTELAQDGRCKAIGEIGLDYYWVKDRKARAWQQYFFKAQLELALKLDLPVIIHSREAAADTFSIMKEACAKGVRAVIHSYSYSPEMAMDYIDMGCCIGVGGVVTFKNAKKIKEVVRQIPLERILVETDCPYMAPEPFRGMRNDSGYLPYIIKYIAGLKELTEYRVMETTRKNGYDFFSIS
ncbi:MAG: TatD family deoxyribonuclease [Lachnospiraceae bacterium]|uniref:TatD family deoxyribonuclease n=1 Tax=Candidatus Weimeria bifida TaxID=2599074 RepID=A0A6N7J2Y5_9FIRM|nr:TatD family deoxyribonuclease [Candidatus Weimeria bifida]RRF96877.1 MAG: TatD family deoxyribonuclease [Lachnospiraceae bacterium]